MRPMAAILSLLIAAAGWYYLFYSRAAQNLGGLEARHLNARRVRLRRLGGAVMFALAVAFFMLFWTFGNEPRAFVIDLLVVLVLLLAIVVLALIDLRLTWRIRDAHRRHQRRPDPPA